MLGVDLCSLLKYLPMASWLRMLAVGENVPSHKCALRNLEMRLGMAPFLKLPI